MNPSLSSNSFLSQCMLVPNMVLKYQKWYKIIELLANYPNDEFTIRKIAKKTGMSPMSVLRYIRVLTKENLVESNLSLVYTPYSCFLKTTFIIDKLYTCGLIDFLIQALNPNVIILFGSIRKGEYDHDSDVDIFVETHKKVDDLDLHIFEKRLKRRIDIHREESILSLPERLRNNVVNGIKLFGYLSVYEDKGMESMQKNDPPGIHRQRQNHLDKGSSYKT